MRHFIPAAPQLCRMHKFVANAGQLQCLVRVTLLTLVTQQFHAN